MQFRVAPQTAPDASRLRSTRAAPWTPLRPATGTRRVSLNERTRPRSWWATITIRGGVRATAHPPCPSVPVDCELGTVDAAAPATPLGGWTQSRRIPRWAQPRSGRSTTPPRMRIRSTSISPVCARRTLELRGARFVRQSPGNRDGKDTVVSYPGEVRAWSPLRSAGPVRLALPHPRSRGPRHDASVRGRRMTGRWTAARRHATASRRPR